MTEPVRLAALSPIRNGMDATSYMRSLLPAGSSIMIDFRGERDRNKHYWAALYLEDGTFVNELLVRSGYAKITVNGPYDSLAEQFRPLVEEAMLHKKGVWGITDPYYKQSVKMISIDGEAAIVTMNGELWVWGQFFEKPTRILTGVVQARTDWDTGAALKKDGTVWVWGFNNAAGWGNGEQAYEVTIVPQQVKGLSNILSLEKNNSSTIVIDRSGNVFGWGSNFNGRLGQMDFGPSNIIYSKPFKLPWTNVKEVKIGFPFTIVVKKNGTVWQTAPDSDQLVQLQELRNVVTVATSNTAALALRKDGTVWGWGQWNNGIFGNQGLFTERPQQIAGLSQIAKIESGMFHFFAIDVKGNLFGWGNNEFGELGSTSIGDRIEKPIRIPLMSGINQVAAASEKSLFLKRDGTLWGVGHSPYSLFGEDYYEKYDLKYHQLTQLKIQ
ncbi:hypothetical protein FHS18_003881 [Paenibacillus phyllosphaerae]|uniref:TNase-like domain-containing protein n=1 Tax=Paenibacillus phyllosphaerae TaxID=274593 RepID=A0A7W5AZT6_9BACL|nr:hypothetical protein [Paenibacillus phyllosphaerae]